MNRGKQSGHVVNFIPSEYGDLPMKGSRRLCTAAILIPAMLSTASAEERELSGDELKVFCDNSDQSELCVGYVNGVADAMVYENVFCRPSNTTNGQLTLIVKNYLSEHPEKLHIHAGILVLEALAEAFPCPTSPTDK